MARSSRLSARRWLLPGFLLPLGLLAPVMTLTAIILATLAAGIGSVWLAALLGFGLLARYTQHMLSLAAGALLATSFMLLLPEAFESDVEPQMLFGTVLAFLIFFFLLDKAELWHHGHEHHHEHHHEHAQGHGHDRGPGAHHAAPGDRPLGSGGWAVLAGDSLHCFADGVLIASAFVADMGLGVLAAMAVLLHEVPHHMGDLAVVRTTSHNRRAAIIKVSMAGSVTALGGVVGFFLVDQLHDHLPYFLVVAASSFMYVALADLIPQLQKKLSLRETGAQLFWLALGLALVSIAAHIAHSGHAH
jgi:zinc and cadmium transporter